MKKENILFLIFFLSLQMSTSSLLAYFHGQRSNIIFIIDGNEVSIDSTNFTASGSKLNSARSSLDRIKARQQKNADQLKAGEALAAEATGASLEAKLSGLGITKTSSKGGDILAKLKAKKKG